MDNRPIGVFDSGLGGLTVVKELQQILPQEDIVYFGDTGRVPYGTRSRDTILRYAAQDIAFLQQKQVKMVIAACGTVSSVLPEETAQEFSFPYTGVVLPASMAAAAATKNGKIGAIGTTATIRSRSYERAIRSVKPQAEVIGIACPLFVPLVENGYIGRDNQVTRLVAEDYLAPLKAAGVDTLILGCTHFPIIREIVADVMGKGVVLIDPGAETAHSAASTLQAAGMLHEPEHTGRCSFYVSDSADSFSDTALLFLGRPVRDDVELVSAE